MFYLCLIRARLVILTLPLHEGIQRDDTPRAAANTAIVGQWSHLTGEI